MSIDAALGALADKIETINAEDERMWQKMADKVHRDEDRTRRKELEAAAFAYLNRRIGLYSTAAQVRAAAKKIVDMDLARVRRGEQV